MNVVFSSKTLCHCILRTVEVADATVQEAFKVVPTGFDTFSTENFPEFAGQLPLDEEYKEYMRLHNQFLKIVRSCRAWLHQPTDERVLQNLFKRNYALMIFFNTLRVKF